MITTQHEWTEQEVEAGLPELFDEISDRALALGRAIPAGKTLYIGHNKHGVSFTVGDPVTPCEDCLEKVRRANG